jgi:molybdopterin-guanine dinucleotide biosynthesis protein A
MTPRTIGHDAIVLAGGRAARLGGIDKPALVVGGATLAEHAVRAVPHARAVAFVSHRAVPTGDPRVRHAREEPRWAGPVAALDAGLARLADDPAPYTVVLAADLVAPASAVAALLGRIADAADDSIVATDPTGARQPLLAVYRTAALDSALRAVTARPAESARGPSMRAVLERLEVREVGLPAEWCADVDTPADAARYGIRLPEGAERVGAA